RAVKLGMIGAAELAKAIANALHLTNAPGVWDPIAAPSRGAGDYAIGDVLALLARRPVDDLASAEAAAQALASELDCAVLIKGGHIAGDEAIDVLVHGRERTELRSPRVRAGEH